MKRTIAILLALTLLLSAGLLAGCKKGGEPTPETEAVISAAGTYTGQYTKFVGDDEKDTSGAFSLTLNEDGTGAQTRDGMTFKVTWTQDGDAITMDETYIGDPITYTGTLQNGELHLFNGDPADIWTCEYVYTQDAQ